MIIKQGLLQMMQMTIEKQMFNQIYYTPPLQNRVLGVYTVFSMSVIPSFQISSTFNDFAL